MSYSPERDREHRRLRYNNDNVFREKHKRFVRETLERLRMNNPELAKQRQRETHKRRMRKLYDYVDSVKAASPCIDCKLKFPPWILAFDHRNAEEKTANISDLVKLGRKRSIIDAEIAKCDIVCHNCHADRTYNRRHNIS